MRAAAFLLVSLLAHAALLLALPTTPPAELPRLGRSTISVRLLPAEASASLTSVSPEARKGGRQHDGEPAALASAPAAAVIRHATQPDNWLPSGKLTRLPQPLDPLELDDPPLGAYSGRIELILLVDRLGRVREVRTRNPEPEAQRFAAMVAPRFKAARFSPGEVDGVAVNAILKIAVVSQRLPSSL